MNKWGIICNIKDFKGYEKMGMGSSFFDEIINNFPNCETVLYAKVWSSAKFLSLQTPLLRISLWLPLPSIWMERLPVRKSSSRSIKQSLENFKINLRFQNNELKLTISMWGPWVSWAL